MSRAARRRPGRVPARALVHDSALPAIFSLRRFQRRFVTLRVCSTSQAAPEQYGTALLSEVHHSNVGATFQNKNETGFCRVIDPHQRILLHISGTGFRIQTQTDLSLPTRRQHPIKMGDFSASAGFHRLYFQLRATLVHDLEVVDKNGVFILVRFQYSCALYRLGEWRRRWSKPNSITTRESKSVTSRLRA